MLRGPATTDPLQPQADCNNWLSLERAYPFLIKKSKIVKTWPLRVPLTPAFIAQSRMKRVTFELSDELHKKLKLLCYTESVSIGHILRQCVSDFCVKHDAHLIELIDNRSK